MSKYVILIVIALAFTACGNTVDHDAPASPGEPGLLQVDHIEVQIAESFPPQVRVQVSGTLPDGCTSLSEIRQEREDTTITVTMTTRRLTDAMCIQVIEPVVETIQLQGDFPPGEYIVRVNDVEQPFRI